MSLMINLFSMDSFIFCWNILSSTGDLALRMASWQGKIWSSQTILKSAESLALVSRALKSDDNLVKLSLLLLATGMILVVDDRDPGVVK